MNWGVNEWVAAASAAVALASLMLNWMVVRRQTALQFESLKAQMDAEVLAWAHEAIDLVSQGAALARDGGSAYTREDFRRLVFVTRHELSAAADRGRLFFPNEEPAAYGQHKESAFQGFRPPILDALVLASLQMARLTLDATSPDEEAASFLVKCQRLLVSEAQNAIDPRRRGQMLRRLAVGRLDDKQSAFAAAAGLREALERRLPGSVSKCGASEWDSTTFVPAARNTQTWRATD